MRGVGGQEKTTLSLWKNVTISLGGVGVKVNLDNVTNLTGFFLKASLMDVIKLYFAWNLFFLIFIGNEGYQHRCHVQSITL